MDFKTAFKRPFTDYKKLSIGAILYMVPGVNIVSGLFASGYLLECSTKIKKDNLPEWGDWKKYVKHGLLMAIISLSYMVPFLILAYASMNLSVGNSPFSPELIRMILSSPESSAMMFSAALTRYLVIYATLLFFLAYYTPLAMVSYANGNLKDAYNLKEITLKAFTKDYFFAWIVVMLYSGLISYAEDILRIIIGQWVVMQVISAYFAMITGVTLFTLYGYAYRGK